MAAICAPSSDEPEPRDTDALQLLTQLTDKSLVMAIYHGERMRYRLLEPIRQYAAALLRGQPADEEQTLRTRHLDFFLALAQEAEPLRSERYLIS